MVEQWTSDGGTAEQLVVKKWKRNGGTEEYLMVERGTEMAEQ